MFSKIKKRIIRHLPVSLLMLTGALALGSGVSIDKAYAADGGVPIMTAIKGFESGGMSNPVSAYNPAGKGLGAFGQFQERADTLVSTGYMTKDSSGNYAWSGKDNVNSTSDFLSCSSCQVNSETQNLKMQWQTLNQNGATDYIGKQGPDGVTYNESALVECSQQLGATGCKRYLDTGDCHCANPHIADDIAAASQADSSSITNGQNTQVDNSSFSGGTMSNGTALAGIESACAKEVADALKQLGQQEVNGAQLLAQQPGTGFTLANGQSPMTSDGTTGGQNPFSIGSCLNSLRPGIGINMFFGGSGNLVSNLINQLKSEMCSALRSTISTATSPIYSAVNNSIGGAMSTMDSMRLGGPIGGYLPSLGSVVSQSGFNVSAGQAGLGQSGFNINGQNYGLGSLSGTQAGNWLGMQADAATGYLSNALSPVNFVADKALGYAATGLGTATNAANGALGTVTNGATNAASNIMDDMGL